MQCGLQGADGRLTLQVDVVEATSSHASAPERRCGWFSRLEFEACREGPKWVCFSLDHSNTLGAPTFRGSRQLATLCKPCQAASRTFIPGERLTQSLTGLGLQVNEVHFVLGEPVFCRVWAHTNRNLNSDGLQVTG